MRIRPYGQASRLEEVHSGRTVKIQIPGRATMFRRESIITRQIKALDHLTLMVIGLRLAVSFI